MKKQYLIFDLDWTLVDNWSKIQKIIFQNIEKYYPDYLEKAKRLFFSHWNHRLDIYLKEVFDSNENICNVLEEKIKFNFIELNNQTEFFPWVQEKIKDLSQNFKLFLTTSSPTHVAKEHLEKWWIIKYFELIYWSDIIPKWKNHLDIFRNYSEDEKFFEKSFYIWDWDNDSYFAKESWIDFIRIGKFWKDKYEINSVTEIDILLEWF